MGPLHTKNTIMVKNIKSGLTNKGNSTHKNKIRNSGRGDMVTIINLFFRN